MSGPRTPVVAPPPDPPFGPGIAGPELQVSEPPPQEPPPSPPPDQQPQQQPPQEPQQQPPESRRDRRQARRQHASPQPQQQPGQLYDVDDEAQRQVAARVSWNGEEVDLTREELDRLAEAGFSYLQEQRRQQQQPQPQSQPQLYPQPQPYYPQAQPYPQPQLYPQPQPYYAQPPQQVQQPAYPDGVTGQPPAPQGYPPGYPQQYPNGATGQPQPGIDQALFRELNELRQEISTYQYRQNVNAETERINKTVDTEMPKHRVFSENPQLVGMARRTIMATLSHNPRMTESQAVKLVANDFGKAINAQREAWISGKISDRTSSEVPPGGQPVGTPGPQPMTGADLMRGNVRQAAMARVANVELIT